MSRSASTSLSGSARTAAARRPPSSNAPQRPTQSEKTLMARCTTSSGPSQPMSVFVDAHGNVVERHSGMLCRAQLDAGIDDLLAERGGDGRCGHRR